MSRLLAVGVLLGGLSSVWGSAPGLADTGEPIDADGDGYTADVDCDDTSASVHPGAYEIVPNGIDEDCDGLIDEDSPWYDDDGDGYTEFGNDETPPGDCDDYDPDSYPGAPEICDGADNDCDFDIDEDCEPITETVVVGCQPCTTAGKGTWAVTWGLIPLLWCRKRRGLTNTE